MKQIPEDLFLYAVDLRAIDERSLDHAAMAVASIPRTRIRVRECAAESAIASWRRDVYEDHEASKNLTQCVLEAKRSNFFYLLVDMISIEQDSADVVRQIIDFSHLYSHLRSIIAYEVDDDIRRPWLRNEALRILTSPTRLGYVLGKWEGRIPLRPSLLIRQFCNRRLGVSNANLSRLKLCDTYLGRHMVLSDLEITTNLDPDHPFTSINLDLRRQRYASDALLIFEINRDSVRESLVERLVDLQSNSIVVPALAGIWASAEGLSVTFRWSDWDSNQILNRLEDMIQQVIASFNSTVRLQKERDSWRFCFEGDISGDFSANIMAYEGNELMQQIIASQQGYDLMIRCAGAPLEFRNSEIKHAFLLKSLDVAKMIREAEGLTEELGVHVFENQGGIIFDDYRHHEDIYDRDEGNNTAEFVSAFVSDENLAIVDRLVREAIVQEHVHFRIDVKRLEAIVRRHKPESHRIVLLYLCEASDNGFLFDLAMAISDMWWFVYGDNHLQAICKEIGNAIEKGETVGQEDVMQALAKLYSD